MRDTIAAVVTVAAGVVVGLYGRVVGEALEVARDDGGKLFAGGALVHGHKRVKDGVVRNEVFQIDAVAVVEVDLDFGYFAVLHLQACADIDGFTGRCFPGDVLDDVALNGIGIYAFRQDLLHAHPTALRERDGDRVFTDLHVPSERKLVRCMGQHARVEQLCLLQKTGPIASGGRGERRR